MPPFPHPGSGVRNPVGVHFSGGTRGLDGVLSRVDELGCEAVQLLIDVPSEGAPPDPVAANRFRDGCAERGLRVFAHAPYRVNLASPTSVTQALSAAALTHSLARGRALGAEAVVVHPGSYVDSHVPAHHLYAQAMAQVRATLLPILDSLTDDDPWVLIEPTAGVGRSVCPGVEDLSAYFSAIDFHPRAGVCLDTCHAFAAGALLDRPGGPGVTLASVAALGPDRLRLIHANDAAGPRASSEQTTIVPVHRHAGFGTGLIGLAAFGELLSHPLTAGVPFILETAEATESGNTELDLLKKLREESPQ